MALQRLPRTGGMVLTLTHGRLTEEMLQMRQDYALEHILVWLLTSTGARIPLLSRSPNLQHSVRQQRRSTSRVTMHAPELQPQPHPVELHLTPIRGVTGNSQQLQRDCAQEITRCM